MIHINNIRTHSAPLSFDTALTIGNFDGCHLGHQQLLNTVIERSSTQKLAATAMTFDPAPEQFFRGDAGSPPRIFTLAQKLRAFAELGMAVAVVETFDAALAQMTHEEFFREILVGKLRVRDLTVGYDFQFGKGRRGNATYLAEACAKHGIHFTEGTSVLFENDPVSSTCIRQTLIRGAIDDATAMLGRPYLLEGTVGRGDQNGRKLGFPTANLTGCQQILPRLGVYAGFATFGATSPIMTVGGTVYPAVINIGVRPTMTQTHDIRVEAHCYNQTFGIDELYDLPMGIYVVARLRDEQKFTSLEELKDQIRRDIAAAKSLNL